jgi:predicted ArsR family transcriptional regulator
MMYHSAHPDTMDRIEAALTADWMTSTQLAKQLSLSSARVRENLSYCKNVERRGQKDGGREIWVYRRAQAAGRV